MASTGLSRSKFEMKDSWGAPFVRVVVGRVDVDGETAGEGVVREAIAVCSL